MGRNRLDELATELVASIGGATGMMTFALSVGATALLLLVNCLMIGFTGQSIGKRMVGIRIVRTDGAPIGFVRGVLVRYIAFWVLVSLLALIPIVGPLLPVIDLVPIFGGRRRCLHDRLAGSKVVWAGDRTGGRWATVFLAGLLALGAAASLGPGRPMLAACREWMERAWAGSDEEAPVTIDAPTPEAVTPDPGRGPASVGGARGLERSSHRRRDEPPPSPRKLAPNERGPRSEPAAKPLYRYVDDDGLLHVVDDVSKIPKKHRDRARRF